MYINDTEHRGIVSCIASMSIQHLYHRDICWDDHFHSK